MRCNYIQMCMMEMKAEGEVVQEVYGRMDYNSEYRSE